MAKTVAEHTADMKAYFDRWYAQDKQVGVLVEGIKMMMDCVEAPDEIKAHVVEGFGLLADKAFLEGSRHGSKLAMALMAERIE